jgi:hypothetical protein
LRPPHISEVPSEDCSGTACEMVRAKQTGKTV